MSPLLLRAPKAPWPSTPSPADKANNWAKDDESILSEFSYYAPPGPAPVVDIGAADKLADLVGWADTDLKVKVAEVSLLKDRKHKELLKLIHDEEVEEVRRQSEERRNPHPARNRRLRVRHKKEREERRVMIERLRQENEMIVANVMADYGLIR